VLTGIFVVEYLLRDFLFQLSLSFIPYIQVGPPKLWKVGSDLVLYFIVMFQSLRHIVYRPNADKAI
jgi:hypothetical protein